jgi:hypothetical protein
MAKIKVKKIPGGGMGDKPEQGTPAHEKHMAMLSGKSIKLMDERANKMLKNQLKEKWQK